MENNMDKSLLFMTLSLVCIWLIVDAAIGKNYVGNFLSTFGFGKSSDDSMTKEEVKEAQEKAPSNSAIGSNKEAPRYGNSTTPGINSVPYGARRPGRRVDK